MTLCMYEEAFFFCFYLLMFWHLFYTSPILGCLLLVCSLLICLLKIKKETTPDLPSSTLTWNPNLILINAVNENILIDVI